jgi:hypothetical protein
MSKPLYTVMGRYAHKPGWYPSPEVMTSVGAQMEAERANLSAYFLYPEGNGKMQGRIRKSEPANGLPCHSSGRRPGRWCSRTS